MSSSQTRNIPDEFHVRAKAVYRRLIDRKTEEENNDQIIVFDLNSEDFEVGDDRDFVQMVLALKARRPDAEVTGFRIGDGGRAIDRFGSPRFARGQ